VVFDPLSLFVLDGSAFLLINVVSEFVIGYNEGIELLGILNAVRVIVVLGRSLDDESLVSKLVQQSHVVRHLGRLCLSHVQSIQSLLLVHFLIVKEVVGKEAYHLMPVLLEELKHYLDPLHLELRVLSVSHCHILCIDHYQRLLIVPDDVAHSHVINLSEYVVGYLGLLMQGFLLLNLRLLHVLHC
jgi:hypothetical protein